jgi:glycosyltransferase involved in cell wall biosynthesis
VLLGQARSFRTIYYGLDTVAFSPRPKEECRRSLGVEPGRFVVCFGADFTASRRKGLRELLSALTTVATASPVLCLSFGNDSPPEVDPRVEIRSLGYLGSAEALSTAYSAADLFLIPSLHEAFGQVAMEAMACGTPVVGFDTGGIPEMVRPGVTGLVAHRGDVADLAAKIQWMIDNPAERERMGREARLTVLRDFPGERQGVLYRELYESLLHRSA